MRLPWRYPLLRLHGVLAPWTQLILPRFGGQFDYAAITDICIFNSNSIGLT